MITVQKLHILIVTGALVCIGISGCAKKTDTASQGLDASPAQKKEIRSASENAPQSANSGIGEKSVNRDNRDLQNSPEKLSDVYFDFNSPLIRSDMKSALNSDVAVMKTIRSQNIKIEGYCDERGTGEYNLVLGNKRAYSVKTFLIAEGVDGRRLSTISYGKERPVCTEHSETCYSRNRRVHFNEQ